jgi:hypothetical protein
MAIQRRRQRPGDLEFDTAAQAAAVDGGHGALRFLSDVRYGRRQYENLPRGSAISAAVLEAVKKNGAWTITRLTVKLDSCDGVIDLSMGRRIIRGDELRVAAVAAFVLQPTSTRAGIVATYLNGRSSQIPPLLGRSNRLQ